MVCANDKDATFTCQRRGGYYCNKTGKLIRDKIKGEFRIHTCEDACLCYNMSPKQNCILGLTGMSYCLRDGLAEEDQSPSTEKIGHQDTVSLTKQWKESETRESRRIDEISVISTETNHLASHKRDVGTTLAENKVDGCSVHG